MEGLISKHTVFDILDRHVKFCVKDNRPIAAAIIEKGIIDIVKSPDVAVGEWIPVTDHLPEENTTVIACGRNGGIFVAIYKPKGRDWDDWWQLYSRNHACRPVAWMPLPEPYKERT